MQSQAVLTEYLVTELPKFTYFPKSLESSSYYHYSKFRVLVCSSLDRIMVEVVQIRKVWHLQRHATRLSSCSSALFQTTSISRINENLYLFLHSVTSSVACMLVHPKFVLIPYAITCRTQDLYWKECVLPIGGNGFNYSLGTAKDR